MGPFGSENFHEDHYLVKISTSYKPRGLSGEPREGSPCNTECWVRFSLAPVAQRTPTQQSTNQRSTIGQGNGSVGDTSGDSTKGCTIPPGQDSDVLKQGGVTHPEGCRYEAVFDSEGKLRFWVPKEPVKFLNVRDLGGPVSGKISNCRDPSYQSVYEMQDGEERRALPKLEVTEDLSMEVHFTVGCFGGD